MTDTKQLLIVISIIIWTICYFMENSIIETINSVNYIITEYNLVDIYYRIQNLTLSNKLLLVFGVICLIYNTSYEFTISVYDDDVIILSSLLSNMRIWCCFLCVYCVMFFGIYISNQIMQKEWEKEWMKNGGRNMQPFFF